MHKIILFLALDNQLV